MTTTFDFQDPKTRRSGSAIRQPSNDPLTEVFYGDIHAKVTLIDLDLTIVLDPDPEGRWQDAAWARSKALEVLFANMTPEMLRKIQKSWFEQGRKRGTLALQAKLRELLGITEII